MCFFVISQPFMCEILFKHPQIVSIVVVVNRVLTKRKSRYRFLVQKVLQNAPSGAILSTWAKNRFLGNISAVYVQNGLMVCGWSKSRAY